MTREQAVSALIGLQVDGPDAALAQNIEVAHQAADGVLCALLQTLGYADVVSEWTKVQKWYA